MFVKNIIILLVIIIGLLFSILYSQAPNLKFEHISTEQGLSHEIVHSIIQDYQGYMWFGTRNGLNKYDGYKFTVYLHDPADSTSISSNSVETLFEDRTGELWIGTNYGGLNKFDREKETFTRYIFSQDTSNSVQSNSISQIAGFQYNGSDILWIGTQNGLYKMDIATQKIKHFLPSDMDFPYNYIEAMVVDSSGKVWLGCTEGGLYKFNPETEQFVNYMFNPNNLEDNRVVSLCIDKYGMLWVGTFYHGLYIFNPKNERFIRIQYDPNQPKHNSVNFVHSIYEDRNGTLWICMAAAGLIRYNHEKGLFSHYRHDPGIQTSIADNSVLCAYEDRSGVLWIGTIGVNKIDPRKTHFSYIHQIPGNPNSLKDNYVWAINESYRKGENNLWIGTKTGGFSKLDRTTGKFIHYQHDPKCSDSFPSNNILSFYEDWSGLLWIGTYGAGLIRFNQQTGIYTQYKNKHNNPNTISCDIINSIFEDSEGTLWIATRTGGLNTFDRFTENFTQIGDRMHTLQVYEDKWGILWIATLQGLKKYDRETEKFYTYKNDPENPNSINTDQVHFIHESEHANSDVLWIGTSGGGLNRFDHKAETFTHFTIDDGLPDNVINGILEDDHGNLWLSTNNGLSRFNPVAKKFRNYDVNDGLLSNQFNIGVCAKSLDGKMIFGTTKGLITFHPDSLLDNPYIPKIVITDFLLFNEPVEIEKNNSARKGEIYQLSAAVSQLEKIELSYRENIFSFEFAALDYRSPEKNLYAYKMEGIDPDWVFTDASRRFATYTHLEPGEYIFRVKGSNNDGIWNESGTSIKVMIIPPWWRTRFAYIFYIVFFISSIFITWRLQIRRIHLRQQMQMEHFEAEKLREVDQLKSRFFANISHEFRTPLTLIKGPVKQIMESKIAENLKEKCKIVLRNSDRLLGLINQILDLSKLESGAIRIKAAEIDIIKLIKGMVLSFSSLAESKKVILKFSSSENSMIGYVDWDKLEKIITNLLSNAFKFTPEGGVVEVNLTPLPLASPLMNKGGIKGGSEGYIQISISNSGPGIPTDQLDKIFDRFYSAPLDRRSLNNRNADDGYPTGQADNYYKKDLAPLDNEGNAIQTLGRHTYPTREQGTGIGLALTKELVEVCHGEISVSSIPDKTTTFTVTLPITKESFKEAEIESAGAKHSDQESIKEPKILDWNASPIQPDDRPPQSAGKSAPQLLIVEDNPDVTSYISSFMATDYRILTAENGKKGLKKTLDKYPDLIISDVMMPEMDGFELCKKIKTDERISHIPVILLTAKADLDSKIEGLEFGADDYVTKPFEARELQMRTKNLINQRGKLREKFSQLNYLNPEDISMTSADEKLLQRLLNVFENHIDKPDFTTEDFAREVGMSRMNLNRKLQALANQSTNEFLRSLRLKRAALLLKKNAGTVSEIAYKVGFYNISHFAKAFRKLYGTTPGKFNDKSK